MDDIETHNRVDIRQRLHEHKARQLVIARLNAPADWEGTLRHAIARHREPQSLFGAADLKLFLESFLIFFTALMVFLI